MSERDRLARVIGAARSKGWKDVDGVFLGLARLHSNEARTIAAVLTPSFLTANGATREDAARLFSAALVAKDSTRKHDQRILQTILFMDLVKSSERLVSDGDHAWSDLIGHFYSAATQIIRDLGGRVIKTTGDGLLATFPSPGASLRAARRLLALAKRDNLTGRIGVHLAEVQAGEDGDIAGLGANAAARIMSAAPPGSALVSSTVKEATDGGRHRFKDFGETALKGLPGIWRLWTYSGEGR